MLYWDFIVQDDHSDSFDKNRKHFDFKRTNFEGMIKHFNETDWTNLFADQTVDQCYTHLSQVFNTAVSLFTPTRRKSISLKPDGLTQK